MTGLKVFVLIDVALLAACIHWWAWRRSRPSAAPGAEGAQTARAPGLGAFSGRVFVIDGDTIEVGQSRVRLFGIDAPETDQYGGRAARSHLIRLAGGRDVRVEPVAVDRYGRIVGRVRLGTLDLSAAMVRDGFAVAMARYHADYVHLEAEARAARRGLWGGRGIGDPSAHRRRAAARPAGVSRR